MNNSIVKCEYIYLIREREFVNSDKQIYKIGRTISIKNRMNQYPKDSQIILILPVDDSVWYEKQLIKIFEERFDRAVLNNGKTLIGNEYFIGDLDEMVYIINEFIHNHYPGHFISTKNTSLNLTDYSDTDFKPDEDYETDEDDYRLA